MNSLIAKVNYVTSRKSPTCLDLFCGAGGLSIGFAMANGRPLGAIDSDADSISTYRRLFPLARDVVCDKIESWRPKASKKEVDVVVGGPPCQGFSLARGLRFVDDPRNSLYRYFVEMVGFYRPKWFVMENVEGITSIGDGLVLRQILEDFQDTGYETEYRVVNMAEYGVPQSRRRAVFVGNRLGIRFTWPEQTFFDHRKTSMTDKYGDLFGAVRPPFNAVNSALSDLDLPLGNYLAHRANAQMRGPRNRDAHREPAFTLRVRGDELALCEKPAVAAFVPGPAPAEDVTYLAPQNELQELLRTPGPKWSASDPVKSREKRTASPLAGTRRLTIREQARLQTFPDWVRFFGRTTSQARQIGNAVPPLFAFQLFRQIFSTF